MKKLQKIILVIGIIMVGYIATYNIYASGSNFGDIWNVGKNFLDTGANELATGDGTINDGELKFTIEQFVDFLWGIGLLIIFIATYILGMKYMMVNPNERSRIKQATTPYIIGVVVIFGAVTIWKFVIDVLEGSMLGR